MNTKKILMLCAWLLAISLTQAPVPQLISYHAVARDLTGKVLSEKPTSVQVELLHGGLHRNPRTNHHQDGNDQPVDWWRQCASGRIRRDRLEQGTLFPSPWHEAKGRDEIYRGIEYANGVGAVCVVCGEGGECDKQWRSHKE